MSDSQSFIWISSLMDSSQSKIAFYAELSTMICICIAVTLVFLFLHKNRDRHPELSDFDLESRVMQGLSQEALEQLLPTTNYVHQQDQSEDSNYCVICLESFSHGETCRVFPVCSHIFHSGCIDAWLKDHLTCPVCRISCQPNV